MRIDRRKFLCGCSAAIAATHGARFNSLAFGAPGQGDEHLIVISLRGGMDGLNFLVPRDGVDRGYYEAARPDLQIPSASLVDIGSAAFGLHPSAAALQPVFQDQGLAIVQAVGLAEVNRSHFAATRIMELGTGVDGGGNGWLTRHLATSSGIPVEALMPAVAVGYEMPYSLLGEYRTVNFGDPEGFNINYSHWNWRDKQKDALEQLYGAGDTWMHNSGAQAKIAMDIIETHLGDSVSYVPANGAVYPTNDSLGEHLRYTAQLIKLDLGLQVATIDFGGWDTHEGQEGGTTGYFAEQIGHLAQALAAFYMDLDDTAAGNPLQRTTVVVTSEFGRELRQNSDQGTEHGFGNVMMVLGGPVNGGLYGTFPGLHEDQLFDGTDVAATTDYRRVLAEILTKRLGTNDLSQVFPGYSGYSPMGLIQGPTASIFEDGFESGGLGAWSA